MKDFPLQALVDLFTGFTAPAAPSIIGATIASLVKRDLTWTDRVLQIFVGSCASWYTLHAIAAIWALDHRLEQAIAFTAGLIAAEALPRLRERLIARITELPDLAADWFLKLVGLFRKDGQ